MHMQIIKDGLLLPDIADLGKYGPDKPAAGKRMMHESSIRHDRGTCFLRQCQQRRYKRQDSGCRRHLENHVDHMIHQGEVGRCAALGCVRETLHG